MTKLRSSTVSGLPTDLIEQILASVPATSLKRLRSTCKQWNALFSDKRFTKRHFDNAAKQYLIVLLKNYRLFSMNVTLRGPHDNIGPCIEFRGEIILDQYNDSDIFDVLYNMNVFEVAHCAGLLLCTNTYNRCVVWNPCTGQTKSIAIKSVYKLSVLDIYALGYGNNKSCHSFKILRFSHCDTSEMEIYEFNSNSWRVLRNDTPSFAVYMVGVSLKGNTYWIAADKEDGKVANKFLISFNFTTERLELGMCLPVKVFNIWSLSSVKEERLSVLFQDKHTMTMEIWMTNNITETKPMSWSNFLKIDLNIHGFWFLSDVSFFIDEKNKVVVCYGQVDNKDSNEIIHIVGEDEWRKVDLGEESMRPRTLMLRYVPSLVQFYNNIWRVTS